MSNLIFKGLTEVQGMKFNNIEGGFGENKKSMLVKDIAKIHGRELREINERINLNRKRFKNNVDIIDLLGIGLNDTEIKKFGFTQQAINAYRGFKSKGQTTGIYILSERGYSKLLKILEDDFAWEQYEKLVDGYFNMRSNAKDPFKNLSKELQAVFILDRKTQQIEDRVNDLEDNMPLFNIECKELQALVRKIGTKTLGGYGSHAYKNNSLRGKVYADIQHQLKREFGVRRYEAIKRCQLDTAKEIVLNYKTPIVFEDEIISVNNQISFN